MLCTVWCRCLLYRKINLSEVPVFKSSEGFARLRISAEKNGCMVQPSENVISKEWESVGTYFDFLPQVNSELFGIIIHLRHYEAVFHIIGIRENRAG